MDVNYISIKKNKFKKKNYISIKINFLKNLKKKKEKEKKKKPKWLPNFIQL